MTILSWCKNPEEGAIKQAQNIEKHPWLVGNVCLMPDTHEGDGMPVGGVVAVNEAVELSKKYAEKKDSGFINAILGSCIKDKNDNK